MILIELWATPCTKKNTTKTFPLALADTSPSVTETDYSEHISNQSILYF